MIKIKEIESRTCDCCGETRTMEVPFYKESYDWINIGIGYGPDGYHRIDLCPACSKEIIKYLKENCNNASNWPINL